LLTTITFEEATVGNAISAKQWVGVDLHLHRSVISRIDDRGELIDWVRIDNDPQALVKEVRKAGRGSPVALEATYGWYWAVDALRAAKFEVHLAHPYGMKKMRNTKRVKTDQADAYELANLLRLGSLPEAWIAPVELRELRELVRHRQQLVKAATSVKSGIRGLLAKHGIRLEVSNLEGASGKAMLDLLELPELSATRLASQRRLMLLLQNEIDAGRHRARPSAQAPRRVPQPAHHQGHRPDPRGGVRRRDRRHPPLPHRPGADLLGGTDPAALRVGQDHPTRRDQQRRLRPGPLGRRRSDPTPVRTERRRCQGTHPGPPRPARPQHRQSRRRTADARSRLLHAARRSRPLPRPPRSGGASRLSTETSCGPRSGMTTQHGSVE
jgi:transposase